MILIVVDATSLERNLNLVFQILDITPNVIVCVNLLDEAKKKGISIDLNKLSTLLGVPVVGTIARKKKTLINLENTIYNECKKIQENLVSKSSIPTNTTVLKDICSTSNNEEKLNLLLNKAKEINSQVCTYTKKDYNKRTRKIDKVLTSKTFGIPIMLLFLGLIFWITIIGANYPSQILSNFFGFI